MKNLFLIIAVLLCLAAIVTYLTRTDHDGGTTLVWTAGLSADRVEQVAAFHEWMKKTGRVDKNGEPLFRIRLEAADNQSTLIQAVSGMAGDLIDHVPVKRFAPMGVLEDITDFARENGLDPAHNYAAAGDLLMHDGKQYAYPCNLAVRGLLCNVDLFRKYGMEPPPEAWTPEEFEAYGLEFIRRANAGRARQEVFFAGAMPGIILPLARSMGGDLFNETLTAPALNSEPFEKALTLYQTGLKKASYTVWVVDYSGSMLGAGGEIAPVISPATVAAATGICVGIGVVFGWYPARRGARMDPVEALRYQ